MPTAENTTSGSQWLADIDEAQRQGTSVAKIQADRKADAQSGDIAPKTEAKIAKAQQELERLQAQVEEERQKQRQRVHTWNTYCEDLQRLHRRIERATYTLNSSKEGIQRGRSWLIDNAGELYENGVIPTIRSIADLQATVDELEIAIPEIKNRIKAKIEHMREWGKENGVPESTWPSHE